MSKHTPGPWEIGDECATAIQIRPAGKNRGVSLALAVDRPAAQGMHGDPITRDDALANARLIAAAPELLEALEHLVDAVSPEIAGFGEAVSAIAKARGEA